MALSIDPVEDHHAWARDIGEVTLPAGTAAAGDTADGSAAEARRTRPCRPSRGSSWQVWA
jgi:hypothetical protein